MVGTPAYMAPEQACGDVDGLDERCDVFGLGAILCEILTGAPPYRGRETGELLRKAARADLTDAFGRLDGMRGGRGFVQLAKACLAAEPADRPRDAGGRGGGDDGVPGGGAGASAQGGTGARRRRRRGPRRNAKRRRLTVALAATVLLAVTAAGAGALWYQQDRAARAVDARERGPRGGGCHAWRQRSAGGRLRSAT